MVWERFDTTVHMHADGTGDRIVFVRVRLQSEGAAREFSVISVSFASAYETGAIDYIRVHKPDGSTIETPTANAIEMPAPVTQEAPLYSDLKEKQLPVRSIAAGDVLEYQLHTVRTKAEVPGQFWGAEHFLTDAGVSLSQTFTLEVPANTYVQVWDPKHPTMPEVHDGVRRYTWAASQLKPTGQDKAAGGQQSGTAEIHDPDEDADGRKLPSIAWTTFRSWAEVGNWYRGLALSRSDPTLAIKNRANELTKDAKTPEEQARALYNFVSTQIRYVGIDFGVGRYQPHSAEEVMEYQYGDCKDKDTLLESLLRAKGFTTAPALIGVNITPVPDIPSPALFNHVITTVDLPSGRMWLDTTPEVAPYRVLSPIIRDELALVVPGNGAASLERTPAAPPYPYLERFEATGSLDANGLLKSHMSLVLRSDNEFGFRILLHRAAPSQWDEAMQSVSRVLGFSGTVSNSDLRQNDTDGPLRLSYDYTKPSFGDWDNRRILPLFPVLEITMIDKDKEPEHDIDQGAPRTLEAVTRIKLPAGYRADLPDAIHVKRSYATYDQTYRVAQGELIIERTVVILQQKVVKAQWQDYYAYTKAIGLESGENYISLTPVIVLPELPPIKAGAQPQNDTEPKSGAATSVADSGVTKEKEANPAGSTNAADAMADAIAEKALLEAMMKEARQLELEDKWDAARAMLKQIKAKEPDYPYVMSMLGFVAMRDGKPDEAVNDYEAELSTNSSAPSNVVTLLASAYVAQKRYAVAENLLHEYDRRNDAILFTALANAETRSGDNSEALETLEAAHATHPGDRTIETALAAALHRMHRDKEAAAMAKIVMIGCDDPGLLSDNAYLLSEVKIELPRAETDSRRAVEILETSLRQASSLEASGKGFSQTDRLLAAWDTLGWILFQQGNPLVAERYLQASWVNLPDVVTGYHLARVLEALGKPVEALAVYEQALASEDATIHAEENAEVKHNIERLRQAGVHSTVEDATKEIRKVRTFQVTNSGALQGSGTFRVVIAGDAIQQNDLVGGDQNMLAMSFKLNRLKIPGALPPGSQARLFRDGVLSCSSEVSTCDFVLTSHNVPVAENIQ